MHKSEVFSVIKGILVDALRVAPERVTPEARIFGDLGAESIDILDIQFRAERAFGLKLDTDSLEKNLAGSSAVDIQRDLTVEVFVHFIHHCLELQDAS